MEILTAASREQKVILAMDKLSDFYPMPSSYGWDGYGAITTDSDSGLLYSNRTGIFSFEPGDMAGTEKMNFLNSDLHPDSFDALVLLSKTSFAGVFYEGGGPKAVLGFFTYAEPESLPDKDVLVLAGCYISNDVIQRAIEFNRSNERYRIVIKNLEEYDSEEALAAGITDMTMAILSGDIPDILVTEDLPAENYAARGLLADIGELIEKDEELSEINFLQNVFDAYSVDGKLYYVIPCFEVGTLIGASSVVGDSSAWSFSDAMELLDTLPDGTALLPDADSMDFLLTAMDYCGGSFIDINSGRCRFRTQTFSDILEYAKSLPREPDADSRGEDYWRNYEAQFREGRTVLSAVLLYDVSSMTDAVNGIFGEEAACVGFPLEEGEGSYLRAREVYAIPAGSSHPEGAWEFLRYYLTEAYQSGIEAGFPVQEKYFRKRFQPALLTAASGEVCGNSGSPKPLSEEQANSLAGFILSLNRRYYRNEEILAIVTEEAEAFFAGDKTAEEAAEIIQNRVQLYLDTIRS